MFSSVYLLCVFDNSLGPILSIFLFLLNGFLEFRPKYVNQTIERTSVSCAEFRNPAKCYLWV